jgi:hypothetical protein
MFIADGRDAAAGASQEFYSRRANGPYYRWWYESKLQQWRSTRVHADELPENSLCAWSWKNVPHALQGSLLEHYLE